MSAPSRTTPQRARCAAPLGPTCRPHPLGGFVVEIPGLRLVSEANERGHTRAKARRVASQRAAVAAVLRAMVGDPSRIGLPMVVCFIRVARQSLDSDNAAGSCKSVRDGVADWVGVNDRDPRITWHVCQEKGPAGLRVELVPVRAWSTAEVSSRAVQAGAETVVDATLGAPALRRLAALLVEMADGARQFVELEGMGAVRLRLHARREGRV